MSHAAGATPDLGGGPDAPPLGHALRVAASAGDAAACRRLLGAARCARFSRDRLGQSALHLAAGGGHAAVVRLLLAAAATGEADAGDGEGRAALQRAAGGGHEEVVRLLLARGADVNRQDGVHGNTAQHEAAWKGYSRTVRLLASAGADLDRRNVAGFTALHLSCQNGHNQSCRELLLAGCSPDVQNSYGDTSLHTAARYGHAGVTRILISAQCRVSDQNKNGDTALHVAAAMGRRKLTRILREAGCDARVRNKQAETARDIALRKNLAEILDILDDNGGKEKKGKGKKKAKGRVKFEKEGGEDGYEDSKPWSPYGCHYFPDTKNFPSPRLDSLPTEPLKKGEQYYLDLAGNICKGPIGVGYTCYCAPLFRHLEARVEKDKKELQKAHFRLRQRVIGLEQKLKRGQHARRSERVFSTTNRERESALPRSRSLEMLYQMDKPQLQGTRSMDELDQPEATPHRPSVKELVARIQHLNASTANGNASESSDDDEDIPPRRKQPPPEPDLPPAEAAPRSRSGVYSPTVASSVAVPRYIEPVVEVRTPGGYRSDLGFVEPYRIQYCDGAAAGENVSSGFAERRVLTSAKVFESEAGSSGRMGLNYVDRDTNNDSGYSTKVYGSSKGNSPSLCSGKIDGGECLGASSLV